MKQSPKQTPTPWDGLVVVGVLCLALVAGLWLSHTAGTGDLMLVMAVDGQTVDTVMLGDLTEETQRTLTALDYTLELTLTPTSVTVSHADCPNQDCVHSGTITQAGQSIVCLPGHASLRLVGTGDSAPEIDVVIG